LFVANAAWLACATISCNLVRAAGWLASAYHGRARGATIRRYLIDAAARAARHGRGHLTLHLPEGRAPPGRLAQPFPGLPRPATRPGQPDQPALVTHVTGPDPTGSTPPLIPDSKHGHAAEPVSGRKSTPSQNYKITSI